MRKRIEKGISIKTEKARNSNQEIYVGLDQFQKLQKLRKENYKAYIEELKKGHPMAK
jgi:hypothetical protein